MRVLVTGASGLIGRELVASLAQNHAVHATTRRPMDAAIPNLSWHTADLSESPNRWSLPESWDATIYLAQSDGYKAFPDRAADMAAVNIQGVVHAMDLSIRRGARQFILASSANVYAASSGPIAETAALAPASFYARTKRAAESLADAYASTIAVTIVRMFTVYGPAQRDDTLISGLIQRVRAGHAVQVQGRRGLLLSPLFVSDAVGGLTGLLESAPAPGAARVFNLGGDTEVGVGELASRIGALADRAVTIEVAVGPDPGGWVADTSAIRKATGWSPSVTLDAGLRVTMDGMP